jgi:chemotaxis protein MotA
MKRALNFTTIVGFLIALKVVWSAAISPAPRPSIFLHPHALGLVFGGTLAVLLIVFPFNRLRRLYKRFGKRILLRPEKQHQALVAELVAAAAEVQTKGAASLEKRVPTHPYLLEGYLLIWEDFLSLPELEEVLRARSEFYEREGESELKILHSVGKFPPAFGLLAATTGMIAMMSDLGRSGQESIGPAMAIALVGTFWGIALSNLLLMPLAEYGQRIAEEEAETRALILDGLLLIKRKESPAFVAEKLNSFLEPEQRLKADHAFWKKKTPATPPAAPPAPRPPVQVKTGT